MCHQSSRLGSPYKHLCWRQLDCWKVSFVVMGSPRYCPIRLRISRTNHKVTIPTNGLISAGWLRLIATFLSVYRLNSIILSENDCSQSESDHSCLETGCLPSVDLCSGYPEVEEGVACSVSHYNFLQSVAKTPVQSQSNCQVLKVTWRILFLLLYDWAIRLHSMNIEKLWYTIETAFIFQHLMCTWMVQ